MSRDSATPSTDAFVQSLTAVQRRLYAYIRSLVFNSPDAEDVLQSTNQVLWTKRDEFEPGTDFGSWAVRVAYYEVLAFRKRRSGDRHVFDDAVMAQMADNSAESCARIGDRQAMLEECLDQLSPEHRQTLRQRYQPGVSIADIASEQGRSEAAVSQLLFRLRNRMMECVEEKMSREGRP